MNMQQATLESSLAIHLAEQQEGPALLSGLAKDLRDFFKQPEIAARVRGLRDVPIEDRESAFMLNFMEDIQKMLLDAKESAEEVEEILLNEIRAQFSRTRFREIGSGRPHVRRIIRS